MTDKTEPTDSILRRTVLKVSTVAAGAFGLSGSATAINEHEDTNEEDADESDDEPEDEAPEVDEPEGFEAEVLAEHAGFTDDVAAMFTLEFADDQEETEAIAVDLEDASNLVFLELNWEPGGSLGWHHHPGPVIDRTRQIERGMQDTRRECATRRRAFNAKGANVQYRATS